MVGKEQLLGHKTYSIYQNSSSWITQSWIAWSGTTSYTGTPRRVKAALSQLEATEGRDPPKMYRRAD